MNTKELRIRFVGTTSEGVSIEVEPGPRWVGRNLYFRSNDIVLTKNTETLLSAALLPCMKRGIALVSEGKVSERFLNAINAISDIFCGWEPSLQRVEIKNVIPEPRELPKENRVGTFFSGGVDSFYTFLTRRDEITDLIFVHGFDMHLDDYSLRTRRSEVIRKIGSRFGKRVIEVETNLRLFLNPYVSWRKLAHGAALASVGHLLFPFFRRIYIPASHTHTDFLPSGTYPLLDPLWSTEALEFVHDGGEFTRIDKVAFISEFDLALQYLRVCSKNPNSDYNCGKCEKCLRTMINLHLVGALDRCATFNSQLNAKSISRLRINRSYRRAFAEKNLNALERRPDDKPLYNALHSALNRPRWQTQLFTSLDRQEDRLIIVLWKFPRIYQGLRWINHTLKRLTKRSSGPSGAGH